MRLVEQFAPIEVGEVDTFGFDFTQDCGDAYIVSSVWTCRLSPYSAGHDPDPQSRITNFQAVQMVNIRDADNAVHNRPGQFAAAVVGPMPASAAGATYILGATAYLSDGTNTPALNATVQCVLPGQ